MKIDMAELKLLLKRILKTSQPPLYLRPVLGVLRALSLIYYFVITMRNFLYDRGILSSHFLSLPVISVGNITVGGTGKTPTVLTLARQFKRAGFSPAVVARGYGSSPKRPLLITAEGGREEVRKAGDEAYLLAEELENVPVVICRDKTKAALWGEKNLDVDLILVDDGFQHRSLRRDYDLVLLDSLQPFGNGHLLPRGFLRDPPTRLSEADGIVLTRCSQVSREKIIKIFGEIRSYTGNCDNIYFGRITPRSVEDEEGGEHPPGILAGKRVLAFSGIGNPDSFENSLEQVGGRVVYHAVFPDHFDYNLSGFSKRMEEAVKEIEKAREKGKRVDMALTTHKDYIKLNDRIKSYLQDRGLELFSLKIFMEFMGEEHLQESEGESGNKIDNDIVFDDIFTHLQSVSEEDKV